jgi:hypothetical protein
MCGRFARKSTQEVLAEWLDLDLEEMPWFAPTYNAAPQSIQPVIRLNRDSGRRVAALMRWGLVPSWAKDARIGLNTINARSEEAATKSAFNAALKRRRCLVPSDAYYEWQQTGPKTKQPYAIALKLDTQDDLAEWSDESFPSLRNSRPAMLGSTSIEPALKPGVHCIRCSLVNLYVSHEVKTGPAEIQINFTIGEDGSVRGFKVSGGIPKDVADKVKASALGWLFEPYEQNGKLKSVNVDIRGRVMIMNPDSR